MQSYSCCMLHDGSRITAACKRESSRVRLQSACGLHKQRISPASGPGDRHSPWCACWCACMRAKRHLEGAGCLSACLMGPSVRCCCDSILQGQHGQWLDNAGQQVILL